MKFSTLNALIQTYNISPSVQLMSDSEWECYPTHISAVYYSSKENIIIFRQAPLDWTYRYEENHWRLIYREELQND